MKKPFFAGCFALATTISLAHAARADGDPLQVLHVATLAPAESPWGQVMKLWDRAVRERTKLPNGEKTSDGQDHSVEVRFYWNGQQGDEDTCLAKIKAGQIDGAAFTAIGLSQIYKPILALQLPGLIRTWETLDIIRSKVQRDFERAFNAAGYRIGEIGGFGMAHVMSKGFAVASPADIRGKRPYVSREDPVGTTVMQVVGGVTPVPLSVPEVLPALASGAVNVVNAPALAAEQLQWASRLDHVVTDVSGAGIGAMILAKRKLDDLTADEQAILHDTGKIATTALNLRIRNEEANALVRLKGRMTVTELTDAQRNEWTEIYRQAQSRLGQGTFPKELVEKMQKLAGQ